MSVICLIQYLYAMAWERKRFLSCQDCFFRDDCGEGGEEDE